MKISQKGLYALQAVMMLARHHQNGPIKVREIAQEEDLPAKFLELILIELKNARILASERGSNGGYKFAGAWRHQDERSHSTAGWSVVSLWRCRSAEDVDC